PSRARPLDQRGKRCDRARRRGGVQYPAVIVAIQPLDQAHMIDLARVVWMVPIEVRAADIGRVGIGDLHRRSGSETAANRSPDCASAGSAGAVWASVERVTNIGDSRQSGGGDGADDGGSVAAAPPRIGA